MSKNQVTIFFIFIFVTQIYLFRLIKCMKIEDEKYYIEKVKSGQINFFRFIVDDYKNMAYTLAYRIIKHREDSEDIVQDSFLKLFKSIGNYDYSSKISTLLYRIVYNTCIDFIRKKKIQPIFDDNLINDGEMNLESDLPDLDKEYLKESIQLALANIKGDYSFFLTLFYFEELEIKEIEKITGVSISSIKVKLHRGRKYLENELRMILKNEIAIIRN